MSLRPSSDVVKNGMLRICHDFSDRVGELGFRKGGNRSWARLNDHSAELIYFHRHGSSYGAPRNASVDIRVMLSVRVLTDPTPGGTVGVISDPVRRKNGWAYHHRFNAETWSTYDRCLSELVLFTVEVAEPWFKELRDPQTLIRHPELRPETARLLAASVAGRAEPENVAASLRALKIKRR
jgi:hypothetical protein